MSFYHQWIALLTTGWLIASGLLTGCSTPPGATSQRGMARTDGERGVPHDPQTAFNWHRKAADQGDATAQTKIGIMYADGQGVPQDFVEAAKWFRQAADQGHPSAQFLLGLLYAGGEGVAKDRVTAAKWFRQAADQGHATAQFLLGLMHFRGEGVAQDNIEAYKWLSLATAGGNEDSQRTRELLRETLTEYELAEAQRLSEEFRRKSTPANDQNVTTRGARFQRRAR
jgi:uncharacterized protein